MAECVLPEINLTVFYILIQWLSVRIVVSLFVCLFVCLSVCLSVRLSLCLYVCLYVCLSVWMNVTYSDKLSAIPKFMLFSFNNITFNIIFSLREDTTTRQYSSAETRISGVARRATFWRKTSYPLDEEGSEYEVKCWKYSHSSPTCNRDIIVRWLVEGNLHPWCYLYMLIRR